MSDRSISLAEREAGVWHRHTLAQKLSRMTLWLIIALAVSLSLSSIDIIWEFLWDAPEQMLDILRGVIAARDEAECNVRAFSERLDLAMQNTEGGLWDWDLVTGRIVTDGHWATRLRYQQKRLLRRWEGMGVDSAITDSVAEFGAAFNTGEPQHHMNAFLERKQAKAQAQP